jgi:hypothetical protein
MTATVDMYPFVVRCQDGREARVYARSAAYAATMGEARLRPSDSVDNPAVLVLRADEPFRRKRSFLGRLADRWL